MNRNDRFQFHFLLQLFISNVFYDIIKNQFLILKIFYIE